MDAPSAARQGDDSIYGEGQDWYLILCLGGLQAIVKTEVEQHIASRGGKAAVEVFEEDCRGAQGLIEGVHNGQAGCGKLLLLTDASPEVLKDIRCVQGLFALVANASSLDIVLPTTPDVEDPLRHAEPVASDSHTAAETASVAEGSSPSATAIARVESLVTTSSLWPAAINVWKRFKTFELGAPQPLVGANSTGESEPGLGQSTGEHEGAHATGADVKALKFRASVMRDGLHSFSSVEVSPRIGEAVWSMNPGWTVDLKEYDVEVVTIILERSVVVGLSLDGDRTKRCSNGRVPKEDKGFIETGKRLSSLRPSTAYLMLALAAPTAGDVVVDCMCGVGTIPFLGAGWFPGVFLMGGEVDITAMEHVRRNAQASRRSGTGQPGAVGAAACAWDAQLLPLRNGTVDAMVVDMPFGMSCGSPKVNAKLYPTVMAEMARVLRPGSGRAVLLVTQPHLLGLPEMQRARTKKGTKKLRKGQRGREGGHHRSGEGVITPPREEDSGDSSRCSEKTNCTTDVTAEGQQRGGRLSQRDTDGAMVSRASSQAELSYEAREGEVAAAPRALWRVKARHAVNVGGLVSYLLLLERTGEPPPPRPLDRRRRFVGLNTYLKRRQDQGP